MFCYLNGKIIKEEEAVVSIFDIGLLRGFGIYEAMSSFGNNIFRLEDHMKRFRASAEFLNITIPHNDLEIEKIILELLYKNGFSETNKDRKSKRANIKFILTGGLAINGIDFNPNTPTFYIFTEEWKKIDQKYYDDGCTVILHEHFREYSQFKTINYISAVPLQKKMKNLGALETLYTHKGQILECATSNFFIVAGGKCITPKDNILQGITRKVAIELAGKNGMTVEERNISLQEVYASDECFLTSSFKDIVPVVCVGDRAIANGRVGEISKKMVKLFEENLVKNWN